jgi:hypothetical protein
MPIVSTLRKLRKEAQEFKANLGYIAKFCTPFNKCNKTKQKRKFKM